MIDLCATASPAIETLEAAGFDLVHAFDARAAAREPGLAMLDDPERRVGYLIGNTRALWPRFLAAVRATPALAEAAHPLDRYTEQAIEHAAPGAPVWFGHRQYDGAYVPLQRLAVVSGFATLAPTHLAIHPIYGPWFALRAVLLAAGQPPIPRRLTPPCTCDAACLAALDSALAATEPTAWLAVRDACPVGRQHRYGADQITYHYTKDRTVLVPDRD